MARLLLVLLEGVSRAELERAVTESSEKAESVYIVAPSRVGALEWLATDEDRARGAAAARVLEAEWLLEGVAEVGGEAGEADVVLAVRDALEHFPADETVLVGQGAVDGPLVRSLAALGVSLRLSGVPRPARAASRVACARSRTVCAPVGARRRRLLPSLPRTSGS